MIAEASLTMVQIEVACRDKLARLREIEAQQAVLVAQEGALRVELQRLEIQKLRLLKG